MESGFIGIVILVLALLFIIVLGKTAVVVPEGTVFVTERLGRYSGTLGPGFHILMPFVDAIRYKHSLKEQVVELPMQVYNTRDDRQVEVHAILRLKVVDPEKASYAVNNYLFAILQLTQTALRQELGRLEADRAREDQAAVAAAVTTEIARTAEPWGLTVLGFELSNMTVPS
jgi:regulator of protease activity HflC (stomatin/prohibitin superfamily)